MIEEPTSSASRRDELLLIRSDDMPNARILFIHKYARGDASPSTPLRLNSRASWEGERPEEKGGPHKYAREPARHTPWHGARGRERGPSGQQLG